LTDVPYVGNKQQLIPGTSDGYVEQAHGIRPPSSAQEECDIRARRLAGQTLVGSANYK